ncbi:MAG TPA: hypothetical protein VFI49_08840, partial [Rudaea sp.]|nr:hypothetical protein [Rudaea sp.]
LQAGAVSVQTGVLYGATSGTGTGPLIESIDLEGASHVLWRANNVTAQIDYLAVDASGNLHAIGTDADGLVSLSLAPDGTVRSFTHPAAGSFVLVAFAAFADGAIASVDTTGKIRRIASDGSLQYSVSAIASTGCTTVANCDFRLAAVDNGDVIATIEDFQNPLHVLRLDSSGQELTSKIYANTVTQGLVVLADGSALIGPLSGSADPDGFLRLDRTGNALATPSLQQIVPTGASFFASAQALDGTTYLLSAIITPPSNSGTTLLSKLSPDGQLLWKKAFPSFVSTYTTLQLNGGRLCLISTAVDGSTQSAQIECHANASGDLLFSRTLPSMGQFTLLDDDELVVYVPGQIANGPTPAVNATQLLIDASGNVAKSSNLGHAFSTGPGQVAFSKNGSLFISDIQASGHLYAWDKDGNALYAAPSPVSGDIQLDDHIAADDDGSVLATPILGSYNDARSYLWSVSPTGATRWLQARSQGVGPFIGKVAGGQAYLFQTHGGYDPPIMERYALIDGAAGPSVALLSELPYQGLYLPTFDAATGLLLFGGPSQIVVVDPATGNLIRRVFGACAREPCDYQQSSSFALSSDGTLRVVSGVIDPASGPTFRVDAYDHADQPSPAIRLDQAGIGGAWYPVYAAGQGFTLDYIAGAQTIFMPWFTYAIDSSGVAGLSWFALQGSVIPGATSADLVIARTDPGNFNSGIVAGESVGTATLSFSDCANGELRYKFDPTTNFGREGLIALTRLTPSTAPCVLADGGSTSAQNANPPAQGFDARQSGSWYDPATGGQGLEFTIIPPGNGSNGLVFAAWFTFDPAGQGDDTIHQHWFTLQGDLSTAADGKVVLPIYRIIGGSLDYWPTQNFSPVGHATLTMQGCDAAQLDYQFDTTEVTHAFAGLSGTSHLKKIGGCPAP